MLVSSGGLAAEGIGDPKLRAALERLARNARRGE